MSTGKPYLLPESLATFERNVELKKKLDEYEGFIYQLADSLFKAQVIMPDGAERREASVMLMKAGDWYGWEPVAERLASEIRQDIADGKTLSEVNAKRRALNSLHNTDGLGRRTLDAESK